MRALPACSAIGSPVSPLSSVLARPSLSRIGNRSSSAEKENSSSPERPSSSSALALSLAAANARGRNEPETTLQKRNEEKRREGKRNAAELSSSSSPSPSSALSSSAQREVLSRRDRRESDRHGREGRASGGCRDDSGIASGPDCHDRDEGFDGRDPNRRNTFSATALPCSAASESRTGRFRLTVQFGKEKPNGRTDAA
ncbi:hypothetical protein AXG93_215s1230 [Marchantia polymorpha subsp. ruderalis]|uniref:Uncharacterized protein n=1 Tax=Marchantia polymorpha subsp. ruderalis TaxID=1480154 RepID=A0A176W2Y7_MARPO|nr:hypothetical protein AXG93_215s1230 [Marchantia polymorpha subsp. ruderalis]